MVLAKSSLSIFALKFAVALAAILLGLQSPTSAAETTLDPAKLKPGDKLEFQTGRDAWETVEFVGKGPSPNTLLVNRPPFPRPMPTPVSKLRLPQPAAAATATKAPATATAPPAAAANKQAAETLQAPRTWSDRTGGFRVEAVFVRLEDGKVVLKRTDTNTEISVPLEKLSDADQKIVVGAQEPVAPTEGISMKRPRTSEEAAQTAAASQKTADGELSIAKTNYSAANELKIPDSIDWTYEPDAAPKSAPGKPITVKLRPGATFFDSPQRILPLAKEKKAFVIFEDHSPGNEAYVSRVQACNLASGTVEGTAVFGVGIEPFDLSPDGTVVLARSSGFFADKHTEMRVYSRTGNSVKPLCAWRPFIEDEPNDNEKKSSARSSHDAGVTWAALVDNEHAFTLNGSGELVLWGIPELKPVYRLAMPWLTRPELSANRKYVVVPQADSLVILTAVDGKPVGSLTEEKTGFQNNGKTESKAARAPRVFRNMGSFVNSKLALSDDGLHLAVQNGYQYRVWDLQQRKQTRDFSIFGLLGRPDGNLDWISDKLLVLDGHTVVDADRRIPVMQANWPAELFTVAAGRAWFVEGGPGRDASFLKVVPVPDEAMLAAVKKVNPDELLLLRPGMAVGIDMQASGTPEEIEAARAALIDRLVANTMSIEPESKIRLVAKIQPGKTATMHYRRFGAGFGGQVEEMQVATQMLSLSFQIDGHEFWKHESSSSPPGIISVQQGETIEQAVQRDMQSRNQAIGIKAFADIPLPAFLAIVPKKEAAK